MSELNRVGRMLSLCPPLHCLLFPVYVAAAFYVAVGEAWKNFLYENRTIWRESPWRRR